MKKQEKGLQKFTDFTEAVNGIISRIEKREKILISDVEHLTVTERLQISQYITQPLNELTGNEKDKFLESIDAILPKGIKNQIWEINHSQITWAISTLMQDYGRMPSKQEIADKTELSRQTIHKHLKEYKDNPLFEEQIERFRFMTSKVLAKVFQFAVNGDVRAAKLYFEMVGALKQSNDSNTFIKNQNNFIQINGTVLNEETLKQLNPEQLNEIEKIIKAVNNPTEKEIILPSQ